MNKKPFDDYGSFQALSALKWNSRYTRSILSQSDQQTETSALSKRISPKVREKFIEEKRRHKIREKQAVK